MSTNNTYVPSQEELDALKAAEEANYKAVMAEEAASFVDDLKRSMEAAWSRFGETGEDAFLEDYVEAKYILDELGVE